MKKSTMAICAFFAFLCLFFPPATMSEGIECGYCGMDKEKFGHSWVIIEHADGEKDELCSLHCAAIDMVLHTEKTIKSITVGDYFTREQIDAERAFWVIGGEKLGVMTARAKWAFKTKDAADEFMRSHGGRPATFQEAVKATFEDMYEDTVMIQKKRRMMRMMEKGDKK